MIETGKILNNVLEKSLVRSVMSYLSTQFNFLLEISDKVTR